MDSDNLRSIHGGIHLAPAPEALSLEWMARLVEIAHQETNLDIKKAAIQVLDRALNPMLIAKSL